MRLTGFEAIEFAEKEGLTLHKKANSMPEALSTFRNDVPPELEALITRALAREPAFAR